jgi:hypothetical protein
LYLFLFLFLFLFFICIYVHVSNLFCFILFFFVTYSGSSPYGSGANNDNWLFGWTTPTYAGQNSDAGFGYSAFDSFGNQICSTTGWGSDLYFGDYNVNSWQHICITMNVRGAVQGWVNSQRPSSYWGYNYNGVCNNYFANTTRSYCRIGQSSSDNNLKWPGSIAGLVYFEYELSAPEICLLASNVPQGITPYSNISSSNCIPSIPIPAILPDIRGIRSSASYTLDTSIASMDAGWLVSPNSPNTGYATLDGSTQFLNPFNSADNSPLVDPTQAVMPTLYGDIGYNFSISAFINIGKTNNFTAYNFYPILSCSSGTSSYNDSFSFSLTSSDGIGTVGLGAEFYDSYGIPICQSYGAGYQQSFYASFGDWIHVSMTMDSTGSVNFFYNGASAAIISGSTTGCNLNFAFTPRSFCSIGQESPFNTGHWSGSIAGLQYFSRQLSSDEIISLASNPPSSLYGIPFFTQGVPPTGVNNTVSSNIGLSTTVLGAGGVTVLPTVLAGEAIISSGPYGLTFDNSLVVTQATQSFTIQFGLPSQPTIGHPNPYWQISFPIRNDPLGIYIPAPDIFIEVLTPATIITTAAYVLDTSAIVTTGHAGFVHGIAPNTGMVSFDGNSQYLDPMNPLDNGPLANPTQATMPLTYGGDYYAYSVSSWIYFSPNNVITSNQYYPILSCGSSETSLENFWSFSLARAYDDNYYFGLAYEIYDSAGNAICTGSGGGVGVPFYRSLGSWQHVAFTLGSAGNAQVWLNGYNVYQSDGQYNNCNLNMARVPRPFCRIGQQADGGGNKW